MDFELVEKGWDKTIERALSEDHSALRIVCPFIKAAIAKKLLRAGQPALLRVITRFDLRDFLSGVSDTAALRILLGAKARIRGIRNLHSKVYLVGRSQSIVTSANLTTWGLSRNHEFGFVSGEGAIFARCREYFEDLWRQAGRDLVIHELDRWEKRLRRVPPDVSRNKPSITLPDYGADVGIESHPEELLPLVTPTKQAFVKFFGTGSDRSDWDETVFERVEGAGCHRECTYPKGKRPRQVEDGAVMFMSCFVTDPNDIIVFGRAVGSRYRDGLDDASAQDIKRRWWRRKWPHYIRVQNPVFLSGTLRNGIPLSRLMNELGSLAFASTKRHAARRRGNTNPRLAYRQAAAVLLTEEGRDWLHTRLEAAFQRHGTMLASELRRLDWP